MLLGFDQREVAVVDAGAADQAADRARRIGRKLAQQRLVEQRRQPVVRHVGNDDVLAVVSRTSPLPYASATRATSRQLLRRVTRPTGTARPT